MAHKAAEKQITAAQAINRTAGWCDQHLLNRGAQFRCHAFIRIDHQNHVAGGIVLRALALDAIALPVIIVVDLRPSLRGDLDTAVMAA